MTELEERTEKLLTDISRLIDEVVSVNELRSLLDSGKKLRIKYGVDCTAPFLHLGHAVNLWTMRRFQEDGHKVIFLIGNFTSKIGDPTGRSTTRKMLTDEEIAVAADEFVKQVGTVLITDDPEVFEIRHNADWFSGMPLADFIGLCSQVTTSRMLSRDMFKKRMQNDDEIYLNELLYPILQGFDSVKLESDLTIVGTDQLFNEMMGRNFQEKFGQSSQVVMTTKITKGLWGEEKQSKSIGNFVALTDSSRDKFGKIMTLDDDRIIDWMKVYTDIDLDRIAFLEQSISNGTINPRDAKIELACAIVRRYHGEEAADDERKFFLDTFSKKMFPDDAPVVAFSKGNVPSTIFELVKACHPDFSNGQIRRLIAQGAIVLNDEKIIDPQTSISLIEGENNLKTGKRTFFKAVVS